MTGERERDSRTLTLKDNSSVKSIWTCLTASAFCSTTPNKHDYTTNRSYQGRERHKKRRLLFSTVCGIISTS